MDWLLIGSLGASIVGWFYTWGTVIIGLGMVIFIHELGHFLVAKACGVKCEKFYVGFDVPISIPLGKLGTIRFPRTLWKKQWGETEYGIGILPLGGYVKMLGQDDNPYKQEAEFERARADEATPEGEASAGAATSFASATATDATAFPEQPAGSRWDPRSYLAKSVPQRMAIISAGVIMNVIFAFVLAMVAYGMGVPYTVSIVGHVVPGGAAWYHNWPVGVEITRINDIDSPRFDKDVSLIARLAEKGQTISVDLRYPQSDAIDPSKRGQVVSETIEPKMAEDRLSRLGIVSSSTLELPTKHFALPNSPAAAAGFEGGDRIVAVKVAGEDKTIELESSSQLQEVLVRHPDKAWEIFVERGGTKAGQEKRRVALSLKPMPVYDVGLVMKLGKITNVQPESPAAKAGLRAGDEIIRVTGATSDEALSSDPIYMAELLRRRAGQNVKVAVMRDGTQHTFDVKLRDPAWSEEPRGMIEPGNKVSDEPMSAPALGITYDVLNEIAAIRPDSPADKSGTLKPGQKISKVKLVPPKKDTKDSSEEPDEGWEFTESEIPLGAENHHWPVVFFGLMQRPAALGAVIRVFIEGQKEPTELQPTQRDDWNRSERGVVLKSLSGVLVAHSFRQAARLGLQETGEAMSMVVVFLRRIPDLWKQAGGPITIVRIAADSVGSGFSKFLLFLTMISANLAVVNILPIPVLDGGHLMFLAYEGIRRKPPSEKVMIGLNFVGLALILGVMVTVLSLDIGRLFGG